MCTHHLAQHKHHTEPRDTREPLSISSSQDKAIYAGSINSHASELCFVSVCVFVSTTHIAHTQSTTDRPNVYVHLIYTTRDKARGGQRCAAAATVMCSPASTACCTENVCVVDVLGGSQGVGEGAMVGWMDAMDGRACV